MGQLSSYLQSVKMVAYPYQLVLILRQMSLNIEGIAKEVTATSTDYNYKRFE